MIGQEPQIDFAWRHASEAVVRAHSLAVENPVVIQASGKEFLFGFPGAVQLIVSETRPEGLKHELKLCRNEQGQFFIRRHNRTRIFRLVGMPKPALNTVWELYLAGLNIHFMK